MTWNPEMASLPLEQLMERQDLPEEDRDELRRFEEVLRRLKVNKEGGKNPPMPDGMKEWLLGEDESR